MENVSVPLSKRKNIIINLSSKLYLKSGKFVYFSAKLFSWKYGCIPLHSIINMTEFESSNKVNNVNYKNTQKHHTTVKLANRHKFSLTVQRFLLI